MVAYPAPSGVSVPVVSAALAERWGNPVTAALVQTVWSALLGAVLAGVAGLMTSYYVGGSAGAAITLYLAVWFAVTFLVRKK